RGEPATDVRTAARTHPAVELFAAHEPGLTDAAAARRARGAAPLGRGAPRPARLGPLMGRAKPWPALRQRAIEGEWVVEGLEPDGAAWMDDGMFARWLLGTFPAVEDLAAELDLLLPERVARMVRATLAEWELPLPPLRD